MKKAPKNYKENLIKARAARTTKNDRMVSFSISMPISFKKYLEGISDGNISSFLRSFIISHMSSQKLVKRQSRAFNDIVENRDLV